MIERLAKRGTIEYTLELEDRIEELEATAAAFDSLLYRFARHVRNTDEIAASTWGVQGMGLLAELQVLNSERYDQEVKATPSPAAPSLIAEQERCGYCASPDHSNLSSSGRWCRLCGLTQGKPEGQCRTTNCLEYAHGSDFCESCKQNRAITDAATRMRDLCVARVKEKRDRWVEHKDAEEWDNYNWSERITAANAIMFDLQSLTLDGEQK